MNNKTRNQISNKWHIMSELVDNVLCLIIGNSIVFIIPISILFYVCFKYDYSLLDLMKMIGLGF